MSQRSPKDVGVCPVCLNEFKLHRLKGTLHSHGPRRNLCPGSDQLPIDIVQTGSRSSHTKHSDDSQYSASQTTHSDARYNADDDENLFCNEPLLDIFTHPKVRSRLLKHIPLAARGACRDLLTKIIQAVIREPNSPSKWLDLLQFSPIILAKPKRGGR